MIEIINLTKRFGDFTAVDHLDLTIETGEFFGLLGPNGAGKTTTISMMSTVLLPSEGEVRIDGQILDRKASEQKSKLSVITQEYSMRQDMTIDEVMEYQRRLYRLPRDKAREKCDELLESNHELRRVLADVAEANMDVVMPGYTHLQHAQPVLFSHHMLAYFWMFARDATRLEAARTAADANPLGAAALAGTTYPLDRARTTELLGFSRTIPNSLDAVSDRDYLLDLEYACAVSMMHLSRLCEEIVLWSSSEFGYITLSDSYSTGSSIMPQKKNPDFAELTRGKCGRVYGDLMALLTTCKSLPLAYNKDLQECKEGPLDAAHTLADCMAIMAGMLETMRVNASVMLSQAGTGFSAATDVADYLAKRGMPFREAHAVVGHLVLECEKRGCGLEDLTLDELRAASPLFEADIVGSLDPAGIARARTTYGGTGNDAVAAQLTEARATL